MYVIYSSLIDLARKFQGFPIKFCKMADDGGAEGSDTVSDANNQVLKPNVLKAKLFLIFWIGCFVTDSLNYTVLSVYLWLVILN